MQTHTLSILFSQWSAEWKMFLFVDSFIGLYWDKRKDPRPFSLGMLCAVLCMFIWAPQLRTYIRPTINTIAYHSGMRDVTKLKVFWFCLYQFKKKLWTKFISLLLQHLNYITFYTDCNTLFIQLFWCWNLLWNGIGELETKAPLWS